MTKALAQRRRLDGVDHSRGPADKDVCVRINRRQRGPDVEARVVAIIVNRQGLLADLAHRIEKGERARLAAGIMDGEAHPSCL